MSYPLTAILSDLHGNAPAVETAVADARRRGARRFVCLGDVVGYGASPLHNLDLVMSVCVPEPAGWNGSGALEPGLCLLGNHEYALLHTAEDFNPKARMSIDWTKEELNTASSRERSYAYWDFLSELSSSADDGVAMFAHGSPRDPVREYMVPSDIHDEAKMGACFEHMTRPVCFVGHSHVPAVYYEDRRIYRPRNTEGPYDLSDARGARVIINVGSVGQPRDGDSRLSYALFDGKTLTFVRLGYDIERAAAAIRAQEGLPNYLADRLAIGR